MTVRHIMAPPTPPADYDLHDVLENNWVVFALCGELFRPADPVLNHPRIDICNTCHMAQYRPGALRPHYVYRCFDASDHLVYVGCTNAPPKRLASHKAGSWWWPQVVYVRNLVFPDRDVALAKEKAAIRRELPSANVKGRWLKDDGREFWSAQDYLNLHNAAIQAVETTHGVYGVGTRQMLAEIRAELLERHGVSAFAERGAA